MLKKVLVLLMAAVMLMGCVACDSEDGSGYTLVEATPIPKKESTGDVLKDNLFFHVDFSKGSHEDIEGKAKATVTKDTESSGDITYVDDEEAGKVANFKKACVTYDLNLNNLSGDSFTMEAYVKCQKQGGLGVICGTYFHNDKAGASFVNGMFDAGGKPFGNVTGPSIVTGTLMATRTVNSGYNRQWNHLVFVHDGENGEEHYYLNGVEIKADGTAVAEGEQGGFKVSKGPMKHTKTDPCFRIGAYNAAPQFAINDMNISYVKLYQFAATSENVTTMYESTQK